jgi:hypothetical protein
MSNIVIKIMSVLFHFETSPYLFVIILDLSDIPSVNYGLLFMPLKIQRSLIFE